MAVCVQQLIKVVRDEVLSYVYVFQWGTGHYVKTINSKKRFTISLSPTKLLLVRNTLIIPDQGEFGK
jgi:hypothetical protein